MGNSIPPSLPQAPKGQTHHTTLAKPKPQPDLLYLPDPSADVLLQCVEEGGVTKGPAEVLHLGLPAAITSLLDHALDGWMDGERDLWDVYVLLEVEETNFKFVDLLLDRGHQLVKIAVCTYKSNTTYSTCAIPRYNQGFIDR